MRTRSTLPCLALLGLLLPLPARADEVPGPSPYRPDPKSVERYGPAYRYPQAGWVVLHVEGEPYERGVQHGRLMAPELAGFVKTCATFANPKAPSEGWRSLRTLVNALFVRRYEREYLEEMKGIADGANAAGARYEGRPLDLTDIVAVNAWPEYETLESGLEALPTGLEGVRFPQAGPKKMPAPKPMHCSAFAATGPATADGKIVFGHITMFALYPSACYNVWLDVKPTKGHRVMMQSYPGGIQSGMDYYYNDAGLLVCETTIGQTKFDITGKALASRIRQALQYADTIDQAVEILKAGNNGLYTNEWLLADIKTNEIAMFELGTHTSRLFRSSKNEWYGGTPGFYWGCNNTKDLQVRLETIPSVEGRPENVVFRPSDRDQVWVRLYEQHKGKIDVNFGKLAFTTPPIAASHSLDAKFTTTDLAKEMRTWALFGPPLGRTWQPTQGERERFHDIKPLVSNPWTVLHPEPPERSAQNGNRIVDLPSAMKTPRALAANDAAKDKEEGDEEQPDANEPAWRGTLLPKTDADIWLATSFAGYERIVSHGRHPKPGDRDQLTLDLFQSRSSYLAAARAAKDVPLTRTERAFGQSEWYRVAAGKGVLVLHELRRKLGDAAFEEQMDRFGRAHAGKEVTTAMFREEFEKLGGGMKEFFDAWLDQPGLPIVQYQELRVDPTGKRSQGVVVAGRLNCVNPRPGQTIDITVETGRDEVTKTFPLADGSFTINLKTGQEPKRVVVDKYHHTAMANGAVFSVHSYYGELEHTLIVYGTTGDAAAQREAGEELQRLIRERGSNFTVTVKADKDVTDADLAANHVLLLGRPDSNRVVERFREALPVRFGWRSFTVGQDDYAHADSAVIAAADNPLNKRYSVVVIAGLSAAATRLAPEQLMRQRAAEVVVLPHGGKAKPLVLPARDLVYEFNGAATKK